MQNNKSKLKSFCSNHKVLVLIILSALALCFKIALLQGRSLYIDPDEGYYLLLARNILNGNGYTFNGLPNIAFPPLLPMLISFFFLFIKNLQLSLNIITTVSGVLLGIITYSIARKKFNSFFAILCTLLVLFISQLNSFLPIMVPYSDNLYRGSDILNCFLIMTSLYFIILLLEKEKYIFSILAGLFLSLAYLTRPEGFALVLIVYACFLLLKITSIISLSYKKITTILFIFLLFSSPYFIYLKNTTGSWNISGKPYASHRKYLQDVIQRNDWRAFQKAHYSLNTTTMEMNDSYWGYHRHIVTKKGTSILSIINNAIENFKHSPVIQKVLFPFYLWIFFIPGFINAILKIVKKKSHIDMILLMLFPYSLLIITLIYPIPRHHLFLVPVLCIYSIEGITLILKYFGGYLKKKNISQKKIYSTISIILILLLGNDNLKNSFRNILSNPSFKDSQLIKTHISQYLQENQAQTIMSHDATIAVIAFSDWQVLPNDHLTNIFKFGENKNVDYIVIREKKLPSYKIIDLKDSYIPENQNEFKYEIIEQFKHYSLVMIVKKN